MKKIISSALLLSIAFASAQQIPPPTGATVPPPATAPYIEPATGMPVPPPAAP